MGFIYKVTNKVNGKIYVGLTTDSLENRLKSHINDAMATKKNRPFYNAIRKYGQENFFIEQIEEVDNDLLLEREKLWIKEMHSYIGDERSCGYNATKGGEGRWTYNYQEIVDFYLKNNVSISLTAKKFNCDVSTVNRALISSSVKKRSKASGIKIIGTNDENFQIEFISIKKAAEFLARELNKNPQTIRKRITNVIRHKPNQKAYGYYWKEI